MKERRNSFESELDEYEERFGDLYAEDIEEEDHMLNKVRRGIRSEVRKVKEAKRDKPWTNRSSK